MSDIQATDLTELRKMTASIMGNLKVLWRSAVIEDDLDENPDALFTVPLGDLGDRYLIESLIHQVTELNNGLRAVEINNTPNPLAEKLEAHYNLALQADSLAELLDKSDLFDWLTEPGTGSVHGSLELLFSLVRSLREDADEFYCQTTRTA